MIVAFFQKDRPNFKRRRARLFKKLFTTFYIPNAISKVVKLTFIMDIFVLIKNRVPVCPKIKTFLELREILSI